MENLHEKKYTGSSASVLFSERTINPLNKLDEEKYVHHLVTVVLESKVCSEKHKNERTNTKPNYIHTHAPTNTNINSSTQLKVNYTISILERRAGIYAYRNETFQTLGAPKSTRLFGPHQSVVMPTSVSYCCISFCWQSGSHKEVVVVWKPLYHRMIARSKRPLLRRDGSRYGTPAIFRLTTTV